MLIIGDPIFYIIKLYFKLLMCRINNGMLEENYSEKNVITPFEKREA